LLDLLIIAIPALFIRLWWTGSRARELAVGHARTACAHKQLQFLDQTAALAGIKLKRNSHGVYCLQRQYRFEFTDEGAFRDTAWLIMHGHTLAQLHFPYTRDTDGNRIYQH